MSLPLRLLPLLFLILAIATAGRPSAQQNGAASADPRQGLAVEFLQKRAAELNASTSLDESLKSSLGDLYNKAIGSLEKADSYRQAAAAYESAITNAATQAAAVRAEIERTPPPDSGESAAPEASGDVEQRMLERKARLASLDSKLSELRAQIEKQAERPAAVQRRTDEVKKALADALAVSGSAAADATPELFEARGWLREAQISELRTELLMLGQELASQPMRVALLRAQLDLARLEQEQLSAQVAQLETLANRLRLEQTEQARIEAQRAERVAADKHPEVAALAARNSALSEEVQTLAGAIDEIEGQQRQVVERAQRLEESFSATRKKVEVAGVSQILGQVLQEQRRSLPNIEEAAFHARLREAAIAKVALAQIVLEEEKQKLRDTRAYIADLSARLADDVRAAVAGELSALAQSRRALVEQAIEVQRLYLQEMLELDIAQRRLHTVVGEFDDFLAENLLWVRSSQPAGLDTLRLIPGQLADLLAPAQWRELLDDLARPQVYGWVALAALAALLLSLRRRRLLQALRDTGQNVGSLLRDRLSDTLRAFGILALLALPWPLLLLVAGWALTSADSSGFSRQFGEMLNTLAPMLFQLRALQLFVAPGSIAAAHFGWHQPGLTALHRDLRWFLPTIMVAAIVTLLTLAASTQYWGSGLGRAAFLLAMLVLTVFFFRLARPNGGILSLLLAHRQDGLSFRLRHLWLVLLVGAPLAAVGVSLAGYMYTAGTLIDHILNTVWFVLWIIILHQFVLRWLVLNQRRLRLQAVRERRRAEQLARVADGEPEETEGALARDLEEPSVDLHALDAASRKLANNASVMVALFGIWVVWQDMLPALGVLDGVTLWTYSKAGVDSPIPITLASVALAVLVFAVMMITVRQLPAFLEITLLQRLPMTQGSRYTVVTLTKYTIVAIGIAWVFSLLGGSWSEIQWIFAALGVGIGFGLQEIVANFVSGLIILFERPIRVGDVVTVGNTDGVVTRIRIRATTIRNWDQKELLVPNKNFITQELLNWSLSDQTTRMVIQVGVAYGSDVERAMLIMQESAVGHSRVMRDPAPFVVFEQFGDNALLLSLRCYIDNIDFRLRTISDLNLVINREMAEAGIEIAFPQRDIHLHTRQPLDVRIQRRQMSGDS